MVPRLKSMCACMLSGVRLFATLWTLWCLPGTSVHGIFRARTLEWVAISFSWDLPDLPPDQESGEVPEAAWEKPLSIHSTLFKECWLHIRPQPFTTHSLLRRLVPKTPPHWADEGRGLRKLKSLTRIAQQKPRATEYKPGTSHLQNFFCQ